MTPPLPARPLQVPGPVRLWHLTSLDAVTVAVTWTLAFAWGAHLQLPWWPAAIVGLSAWAFYIADRLFDARRARTPLRARHHFHWRHRRVFIPLGAVCGVAALALVAWKMPIRTELDDSVIAAAAVAYFAGVHGLDETGRTGVRRRRVVRKELLVAVVFTAACAAPMLARTGSKLLEAPLLAAFAAVAWLNCHAIESWESGEARSVRAAALWLMGALLAAAAGAALLQQGRIGLLLLTAALSSALLWWLDGARARLSSIATRALADLVLLTPLVLVVVR
jgi:hypothetical protein